MPQRISKFLSQAGVCSRRQAESLIEQGRITVAGQLVSTPAFFVEEDATIEVDGKRVRQKSSPRIWIYYKPVGYLTTHSTDLTELQGRPTVFQYLRNHHDLPRVISIGRLDVNSEGLLVLTNDGNFARQAELPQTGWARCYKVRVFGYLNLQALAALEQGITIENFVYGSIKVDVLEQPSKPSKKLGNHWIMITLYEGKNREIRKVMNHLGLQVSRLIRQSYGPFELGSLHPNQVQEIPKSKLNSAYANLKLDRL